MTQARKEQGVFPAPAGENSFHSAFEPGTRVFVEGQARDNVYIIESGEIEISTTRGGRSVPLVRLGAGEIFGEMALLGDGPRTATATATRQTEVFVITQEMLRARLSNMDPLVGLLMRLLIERYRSARHRSPDDAGHFESVPRDDELEGEAGTLIQEWAQQKDMALKELRMAQEIRKALAGDQFIPYLQPIVTIPDRRLLGFEALIRWQHPEKGMIPPFEFIPVAERTNVVQQLDLQMLKHACRIVPELQETAGPLDRKLFISVNLSGVHFGKSDIVADVRAVLDESGVDPEMIKLEITESALVHDPEAAARVLSELKRLGVSIALDDFGTGYSSLSYLHRFAIDTIKIDRSFVQKIHTEKKSIDIVRAIVGLAGTFRLGVVAEGIETQDEVIALASIGCTQAQGYLFSKPLPVDSAHNFVIENIAAAKG